MIKKIDWADADVTGQSRIIDSKLNEIIDVLNSLTPEQKDFNPYDLNQVSNAMKEIERR